MSVLLHQVIFEMAFLKVPRIAVGYSINSINCCPSYVLSPQIIYMLFPVSFVSLWSKSLECSTRLSLCLYLQFHWTFCTFSGSPLANKGATPSSTEVGWKRGHHGVWQNPLQGMLRKVQWTNGGLLLTPLASDCCGSMQTFAVIPRQSQRKRRERGLAGG